MRFHYISALLYLLHLLSIQKVLVNSPFLYLLHDEYSKDVREQYSSAESLMRN